MKFVDDVKSAWSWFSMHAMGWPAAAITTWMAMPSRWQEIVLERVPVPVMLVFIVCVLVLGMFGRTVDQK